MEEQKDVYALIKGNFKLYWLTQDEIKLINIVAEMTHEKIKLVLFKVDKETSKNEQAELYVLIENEYELLSLTPGEVMMFHKIMNMTSNIVDLELIRLKEV